MGQNAVAAKRIKMIERTYQHVHEKGNVLDWLTAGLARWTQCSAQIPHAQEREQGYVWAVDREGTVEVDVAVIRAALRSLGAFNSPASAFSLHQDAALM